MSCLCSTLKNIYVLFIFTKRGKEGGEGDIHVWLPLACLLVGTWPTTQACALTGNRTSHLWVHRPPLNPLSYTSQGPSSFISWKYFYKEIFPYQLLGYPEVSSYKGGRTYALFFFPFHPVFKMSYSLSSKGNQWIPSEYHHEFMYFNVFDKSQYISVIFSYWCSSSLFSQWKPFPVASEVFFNVIKVIYQGFVAFWYDTPD